MNTQFSHHQTAATQVEYLFYIEGVLVPLRSFNVSIAVGQPASLSADIAPFPEAILKLKKGMKVFLFKRSNGEKEAYLRFSGYITARFYQKTFGQRILRIECASFNYKWATMLIHVLDTRFITGGLSCSLPKLATEEGRKEVVEKTKKAYDDAVAANKSSDEIKQLKEAYDQSVMLANKVKAEMNSSTNTNLQYMADASALAGSYTEALGERPDQITDSNIGLTQNINYNQAMRSSASSEAQEGKKEPIVRNIQSAFDNYLNNKGDFMEAIFIAIKYAYEKSDPYSKREFETLKLEEFFKKLDIFASKVNKNETGAGTSPGTTSSTTDVTKTFSYYVRSAVLNAIFSSTGSAPFIHAIMQALDSLFIRFSVDPLSLQNSFLFYPNAISYIPPRCNVLFPNMYNELTMQHNMWQEPTRSFITLPPYCAKPDEIADANIGSNDGAMNTGAVLCDTADPFIHQARLETHIIEDRKTTVSDNQNQAQASNASIEAALAKRKIVMDIVTNEEQEVGITLNTASLPFSFASTLGVKNMIEIADFVHTLSRLSIRSCQIMGCLADDMVVGLPVLIIDGAYSIMGTLESMNYSVSAEGDYMCAAQIGYPKFVLLGDETLAAPAFLQQDGNNKASVEKIGEGYQDTFGCTSIYDVSVKDYNQNDSETAKIAKLVVDLVNKFNASGNRWEFTDSYRRRRELTMENVFKEFYGCEPKMTSEKDGITPLQWTGGIFAPYTLTEYQSKETQAALAKEGLVYKEVNKAQNVRDYIDRIYVNTTGVTAGIAVEDAMLDNTVRLNVSISNK